MQLHETESKNWIAGDAFFFKLVYVETKWKMRMFYYEAFRKTETNNHMATVYNPS